MRSPWNGQKCRSREIPRARPVRNTPSAGIVSPGLLRDEADERRVAAVLQHANFEATRPAGVDEVRAELVEDEELRLPAPGHAVMAGREHVLQPSSFQVRPLPVRRSETTGTENT